MEKKRFLDLLLISFLFIVGVWVASASLNLDSASQSVNVSGGTTVVTTGGIDNSSVWTKNGDTELVNFTIGFSGSGNVSSFNITIPTTGYTLANPVLINATGNSDEGGDFNWSFTNTSSLISGEIVSANNFTGDLNLSIWFNVTAASNVEGAYTWKVNLSENGTYLTQSTDIVTYVDGLRPRLTEINLTDGTNDLVASDEELNGSKYIKTTSATIYATVTEYNFDEDAPAYLYYNFTNVKKANLTDNGGRIVMSVANGSAYTYRLNATIPNLNDTNSTWFMIEINDTYGHSYLYNASATDGFNFSVDTTNPTVSVTEPDDTTISVSNSITYTCAGSDSGSGVEDYLWTITKPNGQSITKTTESITLTGAETEAAGTYTLNCKVTDGAGNDVTSSDVTFTAHITSSGGSPSSGGSSSSGSSTTVSVDNSITDVGSEASVTKKQGQSSTFTLDGSTSHTVMFKAVTAGSVTLEIQSDPIEVTLNVGETKQVDVDADGTDDLEVTLDSITSGNAKVTIKKIAQTAVETSAPAPTTPGTDTGSDTGSQTGGDTGTPSETETPDEGTSLTWLWVLILVIVVVAVVLFLKSKKK